jgi:hypothetical protein
MSNPYGDAKRPRSGASRPKLNGAVWQRTRTAVRRRDGNRCVDSGSSDRLSVHHIVPARLGGADSMANLTTLCVRCHRQTEAHLRRTEANSGASRSNRDGCVWLPDDGTDRMRGPFSRVW